MEDKILSYLGNLNQLSISDTDLEAFYVQSQNEKIPALRPQSCRLLYLILKIQNPTHILEIGTGSGLSTLWMAKACPQSHITTLERDLNRYQSAQVVFAQYTQVKVIRADVFHYLPACEQVFDFIFLDSQKRDYIDLIPLFKPRLRPGGLLVTDNILFGGKVVEDHLDDERKYRSGVDRLKSFNSAISQDQDWDCFFLSLEDGILISRFKGNNHALAG